MSSLRLLSIAIIAAVGITGCGQRAQRTDLAIAPLPAPVAQVVALDIRPSVAAKTTEPVRTVVGIALAIPPLISAVTPSFGLTDSDGAAALRDSLMHEIRRSHAFATVVSADAMPTGTTPDVTITATVELRDAIRIHHGGLGAFWYSPVAVFGWPHSTSSISLESDVEVRRGDKILWKNEVAADDAWWLCLWNWQPTANQTAREFGRTVLAAEAAQDIVRMTVRALAAPPAAD